MASATRTTSKARAVPGDERAETAVLFDQLPAAAYVLQDDRFAMLNDAAVELFGRSLRDLRKLNYWDVIDPSMQATVRDRCRNWLQGRPLEFHGVLPIVTAKGERRWIETFRRRIRFQGAPALLVTAVDLTERRAWLETVQRTIERVDGRPTVAAEAPAAENVDARDSRPAGPGGEGAGLAIRRLPRRQAQVLELVAHGRSNKQIALQLGITEGTAKLHVFSLMRTFQVANRTMLALIAHAQSVAEDA